MKDTPETDALIRTQLARVGITPTALASKLTIKCEELERQRNEARRLLENILGGDDPQDWKEARKASWLKDTNS